MINTKSQSQPAPPHDYRAALQSALSWLGDRYLLAEPVNRRRDVDERPAASPPGACSYSR